jgi:RNA polymerase sigma-70 factor (sigma-E family)
MRDAGGFEEFVRRRGRSLLRLAWLLTADREAAQDLGQEALARTVPQWDRVTAGGDPEPYVRTVIRNVWIDSWRRRPFDLVAGDVPDRPSSEPGVDGVPDAVAAAAALARLAPGQRAVVVLRFYEDLTEVETARLLGCSASTVKSQTRDALARLRLLAPELLDLEARAVPRVRASFDAWTGAPAEVAR